MKTCQETASFGSPSLTTMTMRVAAMRDGAIRSAGTLSRPKACVSLFRSPRPIRRSSPHSIPEVNQTAIARSGWGVLKSAACSMRRTRDIAPTRRLGGKVGSDECRFGGQVATPGGEMGEVGPIRAPGVVDDAGLDQGGDLVEDPDRASLSCRYLHDKSHRWRPFDPPTGPAGFVRRVVWAVWRFSRIDEISCCPAMSLNCHGR